MTSIWKYIGHRSRRARDALAGAKGRFLLFLLPAVIGAVVGFGVTAVFGRNFHGGSQSIEGLGTLYRVSLPKGVTAKKQIRNIDIDKVGADDFLRIFFNNYLVLTDEDPAAMEISWRDSQTGNLTNCWLQDRRSDGYYEADYNGGICPKPIWRKLPATQGEMRHGRRVPYLQHGWNHMIVEVENARGSCGMSIELKINDQFSQDVPNELGPPWPLWPHLRASGAQGSLDNALCDRRIYQFFVEDPERTTN